MKIKIIISGLILLSLIGCAGKTIYYWGDYSGTLYDMKKEPSDKSRSSHKAELNKMILKATSKNKRVPPAIYFELAMMEAEDGNEKLAKQYFTKEQELYPESKKYVELALQELKAE